MPERDWELSRMRFREKFGEALFERFKAEIEDPGIDTDREHTAPQLNAAARMFGIARQDGPGHAIGAAGAGHTLDSLPHARMVPLSGQAHRLAEVGGSNKEEIKIGNSGNLLNFLDRIDMFDLHADDGFSVGAAEVFGGGHHPIAAIDAGAVDAAQPARIKLGPVQEVLDLARTTHHGGHDAAGAGL